MSIAIGRNITMRFGIGNVSRRIPVLVKQPRRRPTRRHTRLLLGSHLLRLSLLDLSELMSIWGRF
jgi:hypothetical protein